MSMRDWQVFHGWSGIVLFKLAVVILEFFARLVSLLAQLYIHRVLFLLGADIFICDLVFSIKLATTFN